MVDMWLARQTPEKVIPILLKVIETAKDEYADAVAHGDGIYCVGYCFGGKYAVLLAGEHPSFEGQAAKDEEAGTVKKGPPIKAGAVAHATLVTREDLKAVKAPLTFACVGKSLSRLMAGICTDNPIENDPLFPAEILEEGKKLFASSNIEHEIKIYSDVPHGFAVYGDYDSATIREAQGEAFQQMLNWLKSH